MQSMFLAIVPRKLPQLMRSHTIISFIYNEKKLTDQAIAAHNLFAELCCGNGWCGGLWQLGIRRLVGLGSDLALPLVPSIHLCHSAEVLVV